MTVPSLACLVLALSGCGGGAVPPGTLTVACPQALLGIDQIAGTGFEVQEPVHLLSGSSGDSAPSAPGEPPRSAAEVRYFRPVRDLPTSNGPIDISARAACYGDAARASRALRFLTAARHRIEGDTPLSAGPLGDEARADLQEARAPDGTRLAQITLHWRLSTVLNTLTVRGRVGAFGLRDVLALAAHQQDNELAITTNPPPAPSTPATAASPAGASPSP